MPARRPYDSSRRHAAAGRNRAAIVEACRDLLFRDGYQLRTFPNCQELDRDGLRARATSASYLPKPGQPGYEQMIARQQAKARHRRRHGRQVCPVPTRIALSYLTCGHTSRSPRRRPERAGPHGAGGLRPEDRCRGLYIGRSVTCLEIRRPHAELPVVGGSAPRR